MMMMMIGHVALLTRYRIEGNARHSRGIGVRGMRLSRSRNRTDRATVFAVAGHGGSQNFE